jgi:hypothetical protein
MRFHPNPRAKPWGQPQTPAGNQFPALFFYFYPTGEDKSEIGVTGTCVPVRVWAESTVLNLWLEGATNHVKKNQTRFLQSDPSQMPNTP